MIVFLPLAAAVTLVAAPRLPEGVARWLWIVVAAVDLALIAVVWARYDSPEPGTLAFEEQVPWIPGVDSSFHVGVDGLSLPLLAMTGVIFLSCAVYALREQHRPRLQAALFLFLHSMSLGLFVAADLILFFLFFVRPLMEQVRVAQVQRQRELELADERQQLALENAETPMALTQGAGTPSRPASPKDRMSKMIKDEPSQGVQVMRSWLREAEGGA